MVFRPSARLRQPLPDRLFTTVFLDNSGNIGTASALENIFGFLINGPVFPLNHTGGAATVPNPSTAVGAICPKGLANLLYNSGTGTGLYEYVRIWKVMVRITVTPQAAADAMQICLAPTVGAATFGTFQGLADSPESRTIMVSPYGNARSNTVTRSWSLPQITGVPKREYSAFSSETFATFASPTPITPVYGYFGYQCPTGTTSTTANCSWLIQLRYVCEFFGRVDSALLDDV